MLRKRLIVVIIMLPIILLIFARGGYLFIALIGIVVGLAAWEFWRMFSMGGYSPSAIGTIGGAVLLCLRNFFDQIPLETLLTALLMVLMAIHLLKYERGRKNAAIGFGVALSGAVYWGVMGGYMIRVRYLPDGLWWLLLVLPAAWATDLGGYLVGNLFGKHAMVPRLSPKKTWEGYLGGIFLGLLCTALLGALWHQHTDAITWERGLLIGGVIAPLIPLGDLGASMFKRFFNLKDASNLIPGHGGVMDRIDTWVWASALGYFVIEAVI